MRRIVASAYLLTVSMSFASPAQAACSGAAPSFAAAAEDAHTILIGTVFDTEPAEAGSVWGNAFSLRVERVVRGEAGDTMAFRDLLMNPDCGVVVSVRNGLRVALALGGHDFMPPMEANAIAHLVGEPLREDIKTLTLDDVYAMAGAPLPDTAVGLVDQPLPRPALVAVVVLAGLAVLAMPRRSGGQRQGR